jgi:NAD(P)-dependent dehydrogenase (short-subunit alcohol dehydrogenase family)
VRSTDASGRVALVTGGSSGIGRASALDLARHGAAVVVVGRDRGRLEQTVELARGDAASPDVVALALDVRSEADMEEMARRTLERHGRIDYLVAAAGLGGASTRSGKTPRGVAWLSTAEWDEVVDTNLKGVFLSNRAVLPAMIRQGHGSIVNVSSARGARRGQPFAAAYSASKQAALALSQALAEEVSPYGIRVSSLLPDATDTPMIERSRHLAARGSLAPARVAGMIRLLLALPPDTVVPAPLVAPSAADS